MDGLTFDLGLQARNDAAAYLLRLAAYDDADWLFVCHVARSDAEDGRMLVRVGCEAIVLHLPKTRWREPTCYTRIVAACGTVTSRLLARHTPSAGSPSTAPKLTKIALAQSISRQSDFSASVSPVLSGFGSDDNGEPRRLILIDKMYLYSYNFKESICRSPGPVTPKSTPSRRPSLPKH